MAVYFSKMNSQQAQEAIPYRVISGLFRVFWIWLQYLGRLILLKTANDSDLLIQIAYLWNMGGCSFSFG